MARLTLLPPSAYGLRSRQRQPRHQSVSAAWACARPSFRALECKFPAARCLIFIVGTEGPTLATILQAAGKSFIGYVESSGSDMNHNPWECFPEGTTIEQDFSTFPKTDLSTLPTVSFVIPGVNDDMHDGTIAQGDAWLRQNLDAYAQWDKANNSLLVVTWDENSGTAGGWTRCVPARLVGWLATATSRS
jgi:Phosphoesterase family